MRTAGLFVPNTRHSQAVEMLVDMPPFVGGDWRG